MSKPLPTLSNMPWNVKQSIINEVDYMIRFSLRKCSRELRDIIDNSAVDYPRLFIAVYITHATQGFVHRSCEPNQLMRNVINYSQVSEDSCQVGYFTRLQTRKTVNGQNYIERAVSDLATSLKNPRSSFGYVSIDHREDRFYESMTTYLACLKNTLEQLPHQPNIRKLALLFSATQEHVLHVLPYLKPGVLKHIFINNEREVDQLVTTEQWRMAVNVHLENESNVRIQDLLHLRSFTIKNYQVTPEEMPLIIQANHPHYSIGLPQNYNFEPIRTWLNGNEALDAGRKRNKWHTKIQGTEFHLEIVLTRSKLRVHRFLSSILENA